MVYVLRLRALEHQGVELSSSTQSRTIKTLQEFYCLQIAVLNELSLASGLRCRLEEGAIPVKPEVGAFCGILGLDPLYMGNEGKILLFVPDNECERALRALRETELGCDAAKIGTLLPLDLENPGRAAVILHTRLGGNRPVDVMSGEGLPRIC